MCSTTTSEISTPMTRHEIFVLFSSAFIIVWQISLLLFLDASKISLFLSRNCSESCKFMCATRVRMKKLLMKKTIIKMCIQNFNSSSPFGHSWDVYKFAKFFTTRRGEKRVIWADDEKCEEFLRVAIRGKVTESGTIMLSKSFRKEREHQNM